MADMPGHHHALSFVWAAIGIILAFFVWSFIQPMLNSLSIPKF